MSTDAIVACADLVGRAGASSLWFTWTCPHVPNVRVDEHECLYVTWHATADYRGDRIVTAECPSPSVAALALTYQILDGATCRCGQVVELDDKEGCRWRLVDGRWQPGCDVESVFIEEGQRGDRAAMLRAIAPSPSARGR